MSDSETTSDSSDTSDYDEGDDDQDGALTKKKKAKEGEEKEAKEEEEKEAEEGETDNKQKPKKKQRKKKKPKELSDEAQAEQEACKNDPWPVRRTRTVETTSRKLFRPGYAEAEGIQEVLKETRGVTDEMTVVYDAPDILNPAKNNEFAKVLQAALKHVDDNVSSDFSSHFHKPSLVTVNARQLPARTLRNIHSAVMAEACKGDLAHRLVVAFYGMTWQRAMVFCQEVMQEGYSCATPHVSLDGSNPAKKPIYTLFVSRTPLSDTGKTEIKKRDAGWAKRHHEASDAVAYSDVHTFVAKRQRDRCDLGLLDAIRCRTDPDDVVWAINEHKDMLAGAGVAAASLHCR